MGTGWYGLTVVSANMILLCFVLTAPEVGQFVDGSDSTRSSSHFIQQFFDPMTAYTGRTKYIPVLATYFGMRRAEVAQPQ